MRTGTEWQPGADGSGPSGAPLELSQAAGALNGYWNPQSVTTMLSQSWLPKYVFDFCVVHISVCRKLVVQSQYLICVNHLCSAVEAQLWSGIHVSLADNRSGVVRDVDANRTATIALGEAC